MASKLPSIDGLETISRIRKMESMLRMPIIAVTSYAMADYMEMIQKVVYNGCLEKSIDPLQ